MQTHPPQRRQRRQTMARGGGSVVGGGGGGMTVKVLVLMLVVVIGINFYLLHSCQQHSNSILPPWSDQQQQQQQQHLHDGRSAGGDGVAGDHEDRRLLDSVQNLERQLHNAEHMIDELQKKAARVQGSAGSDEGNHNMQQQHQQQHQQQQQQQQPAQQQHQQHQQAGDRDSIGSWKQQDAQQGGDAAQPCNLPTRARKPSDVEVEVMYDTNPFVDPKGGAWTQGWEVKYDANSWISEPLNVFIIPHSHNDPGWIMTLDEYYRKQTSQILTLMTQTLSQEPTVKFVWAEISYLSMWWKDQSSNVRETFKRMVHSGQIEIVTGGWVMPDEANSHYFALVDQLIEGHKWVEENLGVRPESGWSIDPFGHSPTMAYILKRADFKGMLIQRIHYEVKRMLAEKKQLEFMWRQDFDVGKDTSMYTHMMPFYSYDVPHTCGPEPAICCQFDFARMRGGRYSCPWRKPPLEITPDNVAERAALLLDQYRKKAQLYATNNVLIPLGDDFRYDNQQEIDAQIRNYKRLISYMNAHPELHVNIKFATLGEYFDAVRKATNAHTETPSLPTLSGDFFSYADRNDNYWTGYFTSRPFYKHLDRVLESKLRAAEILFSIAQAGQIAHPLTKSEAELYDSLVDARRALGLFQHHDGITGTAKDHVVVDYGNRMRAALESADRAMAMIAGGLLTRDNANGDHVVPASIRRTHDALPEDQLLEVSAEPRKVVVYNSKGHVRRDAVYVITNNANVQVINPDGDTIVSQAALIWDDGPGPNVQQDRFRIWFEVEVPPFGLAVYTVKTAPEMLDIFDPPKHEFSRVDVRNFNPPAKSIAGIEVAALSGKIVLEGAHVTATADESGLLQSLYQQTTGLTSTKMEFLTYTSRSGSDRSGAYLFMPAGPAAQLHHPNPTVAVTRGPIVEELVVSLPNVVQTIRVFKSDAPYAAAVDISNRVDVRSLSNQELVMRIVTDVQSSDFYTDLNGFQLRHRKFLDKLPLNANFYPMPSQLLLQDDSKRISLNTRSSLACASLHQGWMEVILDRRLMQDDKRGLGQGVRDNKKTDLNFKLLLEGRRAGAARANVETPTLLNYHTQDALNHPMNLFHIQGSAPEVASSYLPFAKSLPCDVHVMNMRSWAASSGEVALLLHRRAFSCAYEQPQTAACQTGGEVVLQDVFAKHKIASVEERSLAFSQSRSPQTTDTKVLLVPHEIHAFKLKLSRKA
ncbi:hypothetical protein PTSG_07075 [Salpingoeca rosetta]|uniref:Alpha-mannosidase n=1 Tax=Salpingoeca rosetta (strain ATCC 50818 / BSB-021) TaxID=946362 RepID=F2UDZ5_SALR5|nr:uncharacterized protein PTSG_07075 [Salpingoeca rosetta]EGD74845.1 hypothetical protein PTSG_07075 [Salpingoeca rosetta]|eukprot:XP_004992490.1 hypothetical protein PTSG_07075 [Salpingoeca rosetta]